MELPTADELLMSSGSKYVPFLTVGTRVHGTILGKPKVQVQTDIKTGEVVKFQSGDPRLLLIITVQTDMRESDDDDGTRAIWAKGNMIKAIREAVIAANATGLDPGGQITVVYTGDGVAQKGFDPPKLFSAHYVPPRDQAVNDALGLPAQQQSSPAAAPPPQPAPPPPPRSTASAASAAPPAPNGSTTPPPNGIDPAVWAGFTPEQKAVFAPPAPAPAAPPLPPGMSEALWATLTPEQKAMFSDQPPF